MIPNFLEEKLRDDYGLIVDEIIEGYVDKKPSLRVNTIKASKEEVIEKLRLHNILYQELSWYPDAFILEQDIKNLDIYQEGKIYMQNVSAMIPALILNPGKESILDMAASPGGKTTQLACLSNNSSMITAVEKNKIRADRLRYNLSKQGANRVTVLEADARELDEFYRFDKILLDTPCSGSGTLTPSNMDITEELVSRSVRTQKELLSKAISILKVGGELVYSTCSVLKEENELQIKEYIDNGILEVIPIVLDVPKLPSIIDGVLTVRPTINYEGFFVAHLRKIK